MIEIIEKIKIELIKRGIESTTSWLGRGDGPYLLARPLGSDWEDCICALIPLSEEQIDKFIDCICEEVKKLEKEKLKQKQQQWLKENLYD